LRSCGVQVAQVNLGEDPNKDASKKQVMSCKVVKVYGGLIVVEAKVSDGDIERTEYINLIFENYKISLSILQSDEHVEIESDEYKYNEIGAVVGLNETHKKIILPVIITIDKRLDSGKITISKEYSGNGRVDIIPSGEITFHEDGQMKKIDTPSETISWELPTASNRFEKSNNIILYVVGKNTSSKRDDIIINVNIEADSENETIDQDIKLKLTCCRPIYAFFEREDIGLDSFERYLYKIADGEYPNNSYCVNSRSQKTGNTLYFLRKNYYIARIYKFERTDISLLKSALTTNGTHIFHDGHKIHNYDYNGIKRGPSLGLRNGVISPYDESVFNNLGYSSFFIRTCESQQGFIDLNISSIGKFRKNTAIHTKWSVVPRGGPPIVFFNYILSKSSSSEIDFENDFLDYFFNHPIGSKYGYFENVYIKQTPQIPPLRVDKVYKVEKF
jgi:hypothetical protein